MHHCIVSVLPLVDSSQPTHCLEKQTELQTEVEQSTAVHWVSRKTHFSHIKTKGLKNKNICFREHYSEHR